MGSPITFGGFNQVDFTVVLNAIMQQESRPLQALQTQQRTLQATDSALAELVKKLDTIGDTARALSGSSVGAFKATSSDTTALTAAAATGAIPGSYDLVVHALARAQVTASSSTTADTDTTIVASGGSLTIGGTAVAVSGPVTLRQLADTINATTDLGVAASIVQTSPNAYRLVLSASESGAAEAFTIQNGLTGTTIAFTDTNSDGTSGDSAADNAVQATDASVTINNIPVASAGNTLTSAVPGVTVTLLKADATKTIAVTVARDDESLVNRVKAFIEAYNGLTTFADEQAIAAGKGAAGALGRDALIRNLRGSLRATLSGAAGAGAFTRLAEVGIGFTRTGQLSLDSKLFTEALDANAAAVHDLFGNATTGVFGAIDDVITDYTRAGGLVPDTRARLTAEVSRLGRRMDDMQARLAIRRAALQREFIAADQAMSRLNGQSGSLASFGQNLSSGNL